jgi:hypothetical protein
MRDAAQRGDAERRYAMPAGVDIGDILTIGFVAFALFRLYTVGRVLMRSRSLSRRARDAHGLARAASERDSPDGDARVILAAVRSERYPASWRVYRLLGRSDWILLNIALVLLVTIVAQVVISLAGPGAGSLTRPLLLLSAFVLVAVVIGVATAYRRQLLRSRLGRALDRRMLAVILTPQGMVAGKPSAGAVTFHLRYQDVVHIATERVASSGEGERAQHWLHVTFSDRSRIAWECWGHSDVDAERICAQVIHDWRASTTHGEPLDDRRLGRDRTSERQSGESAERGMGEL